MLAAQLIQMKGIARTGSAPHQEEPSPQAEGGAETDGAKPAPTAGGDLENGDDVAIQVTVESSEGTVIGEVSPEGEVLTAGDTEIGRTGSDPSAPPVSGAPDAPGSDPPNGHPKATRLLNAEVIWSRAADEKRKVILAHRIAAQRKGSSPRSDVNPPQRPDQGPDQRLEPPADRGAPPSEEPLEGNPPVSRSVPDTVRRTFAEARIRRLRDEQVTEPDGLRPCVPEENRGNSLPDLAPEAGEKNLSGGKAVEGPTLPQQPPPTSGLPHSEPAVARRALPKAPDTSHFPPPLPHPPPPAVRTESLQEHISPEVRQIADELIRALGIVETSAADEEILPAAIDPALQAVDPQSPRPPAASQAVSDVYTPHSAGATLRALRGIDTGEGNPFLDCQKNPFLSLSGIPAPNQPEHQVPTLPLPLPTGVLENTVGDAPWERADRPPVLPDDFFKTPPPSDPPPSAQVVSRPAWPPPQTLAPKPSTQAHDLPQPAASFPGYPSAVAVGFQEYAHPPTAGGETPRGTVPPTSGFQLLTDIPNPPAQSPPLSPGSDPRQNLRPGAGEKMGPPPLTGPLTAPQTGYLTAPVAAPQTGALTVPQTGYLQATANETPWAFGTQARPAEAAPAEIAHPIGHSTNGRFPTSPAKIVMAELVQSEGTPREDPSKKGGLPARRPPGVPPSIGVPETAGSSWPKVGTPTSPFSREDATQMQTQKPVPFSLSGHVPGQSTPGATGAHRPLTPAVPGLGPAPGVPDQLRGGAPLGRSRKAPLFVVLGMLGVVVGAVAFGLHSQGYFGGGTGDRIRILPGGPGTESGEVPAETDKPKDSPATQAPIQTEGAPAVLGEEPVAHVPAPPQGQPITETAVGGGADGLPDEGEIPAALPDWTQPKIDIQNIPSTTGHPAPEGALRMFLGAPDWQTRLRYCLAPGRVAPKMQAYYQDTEGTRDGQIGVLSVDLKVPGTTGKPKNSAFIFEIKTVDGPGAFPVSVVAGEGDEFRVDWEPFVQCQDALLEQFAAAPRPGTGEFYVLLKREPWSAETFPSGEPFHSFVALPPHLGEKNIRIHLPAASDLGRSLDGAMGWETGYFRVVELAWDKTPSGHDYIRIQKIIAENWSARD